MKLYTKNSERWIDLCQEVVVKDEVTGIENTIEEKVEGHKIKIGHIPRGIMRELETEHQVNLNKWNKLKTLVQTEGHELTEDEVRTLNTIDHAFQDYNIQVLKYGLKGHSGFLHEDDTPFEFTTTSEVINGQPTLVASEHILDAYIGTSRLMVQWISRQIILFNRLGPELKKK